MAALTPVKYTDLLGDEMPCCNAEALRREAVKTQTDLPPPNRRMFTQTPPIPGFSEQQADRGRRRRGQT